MLRPKRSMTMHRGVAMLEGHVGKGMRVGPPVRKSGNQEMMHFCRPAQATEPESEARLLRSAEEFDIPFEGQLLQGYRWGTGRIGADILVVHDVDDKEIDVEDARAMIKDHGRITFVCTEAEGHRRILVSRSLVNAVKTFLQTEVR
jgi:hypothetical protein